MGKSIKLDLVAGHIGTFLGHLEEFKKDVDMDKLKAGFNAIHKALEEHGADHVLHFFEKCKEHIGHAIKALEDGAEQIAAGIEHLQEMLQHVETATIAVQGVVEAVDPEAGDKLDKVLHTIDKVQAKAEQAEDVVDAAQEVIDFVQGDDTDGKGADAEQKELPMPIPEEVDSDAGADVGGDSEEEPDPFTGLEGDLPMPAEPTFDPLAASVAEMKIEEGEVPVVGDNGTDHSIF